MSKIQINRFGAEKKYKFLLVILLGIMVVSCGKTKVEQQKEKNKSDYLLGIVSFVATAPPASVSCTTTISPSTATTNSNSLYKNITIPETTTKICSNCTKTYPGNYCALQLTFSNAGTYSITLTQAKEKYSCGKYTSTYEAQASYGAFTLDPFTLTSATSTSSANPTVTITETVSAGTIRGLNGTITSSEAASGSCTGNPTISGTTYYSVLITKTN